MREFPSCFYPNYTYKYNNYGNPQRVPLSRAKLFEFHFMLLVPSGLAPMKRTSVRVSLWGHNADRQRHVCILTLRGQTRLGSKEETASILELGLFQKTLICNNFLGAPFKIMVMPNNVTDYPNKNWRSWLWQFQFWEFITTLFHHNGWSWTIISPRLEKWFLALIGGAAATRPRASTQSLHFYAYCVSTQLIQTLSWVPKLICARRALQACQNVQENS